MLCFLALPYCLFKQSVEKFLISQLGNFAWVFFIFVLSYFYIFYDHIVSAIIFFVGKPINFSVGSSILFKCADGSFTFRIKEHMFFNNVLKPMNKSKIRLFNMGDVKRLLKFKNVFILGCNHAKRRQKQS
jgi:hypothetical protein